VETTVEVDVVPVERQELGATQAALKSALDKVGVA
jgi:hypothetical protein